MNSIYNLAKLLFNEFSLAIDNIKKYILFCIFIFFISCLGGVVFVNLFPDISQLTMEELKNSFSMLFGLKPLELGAFIFINNSIKIFLFIILGILLAIPTVIFLIVNGWVLGFVIMISYPEMGAGEIFSSLFYHGIFEFTALFLGSSMGIGIGVAFYKNIQQERNQKKEMKKLLKSSIAVFLCVIMPLLLIASIIETILIFS